MLKWHKSNNSRICEENIPCIGNIYAEINLDNKQKLYNLVMYSMDDRGSSLNISMDKIKSLDEAKKMANFKIQEFLISKINKILNYLKKQK